MYEQNQKKTLIKASARVDHPDLKINLLFDTHKKIRITYSRVRFADG